MKKKAINIKNAEFVRNIQKLFDEREFIHREIKEGEFHEIKSDIKFAQRL